MQLHIPVTRDNKRDREQQTLLKSISSHREFDEFDPWQIVPRQIFTTYSRLLISTAFVVSRVGRSRGSRYRGSDPTISVFASHFQHEQLL